MTTTTARLRPEVARGQRGRAVVRPMERPPCRHGAGGGTGTGTGVRPVDRDAEVIHQLEQQGTLLRRLPTEITVSPTGQAWEKQHTTHLVEVRGELLVPQDVRARPRRARAVVGRPDPECRGEEVAAVRLRRV